MDLCHYILPNNKTLHLQCVDKIGQTATKESTIKESSNIT
jgi:hypothetical protein